MKVRKEFLRQLLEIESISGKENLVSPMIQEELKRLGFNVTIDDIGNIFAVRGEAIKYPLLNAHMDIVDLSYNNLIYGYGTSSYYLNNYYRDIKGTSASLVAYDETDWEELGRLDDVLETMELEDIQTYMSCNDCKMKDCNIREYLKMPCELFEIKFSSYDKLRKVAEDFGIDITKKKVIIEEKEDEYYVVESKGRFEGIGKERVLGGDDKCGIFIALEIARLCRKMPMKIMFSVCEEEGCVGISHAITTNRDWFNDVAYSLTIDRREGDHLLWSQLGKFSCSKDFAGRLAYAGVKAGIPVKLMDGSVSDVIHIRDIVPEAVNMSAGYHNPHDSDEYVVIDEVIKIIKWVRNFVLAERVVL